MQNLKLKYDINRRLAVFYHPLFLEILNLWLKALGQEIENVKIGFITFIELNIRLQKALLIDFDLKNAFMSALNDWVKEICDCFELKELFSVEQIDINEEIESLPFPATLSETDYNNFSIQFSDHQAFKYLSVKINHEILSKFLFDLCTTWCVHLDVELYCQFLIILFFQISSGDKVHESQLMYLDDISAVSIQYFEQLAAQKIVYAKSKKKNLVYYRAWCEWNYLRMEEIGENIIYRLVELFPEEYEFIQFSDRVEDFLLTVVKAIDNVNQEITSNNQQQQEELPQEEQHESEIKSQAEKWYEEQQKEVSKVNVVPIVRCHLESVEPLPMDLFVLRYIEHSRSYILEKKVRMPIVGKPKPLYDGLSKQKQLRNYQLQEKDLSVFYTSDPRVGKMEELIKPKQIKTMIKMKTTPENRVNKSFSHSYQTNNVLLPEFINDISQANKSMKMYNQYGHDINIKKRMVMHDVPLKFEIPKAMDFYTECQDKELGKINSSNVSQLHNVGLTYKSLEKNRDDKIEETKHLWEPMLSLEEMEVLKQDEKKFYHILNLLKMKFNYEHRSEYLSQCKLKLSYFSKRDEMGGVITNEDMKRFRERITRILEREKKRKRRRRVVDVYQQRFRNYSVKTKFKNRQQRVEFNKIFILPLKNKAH